MSDSSLTDRPQGSTYCQLTEAFHDVLGKEHGAIFFFVSSGVIVNRIDDLDIGWVHDCVVGESKDIDELVSEDGHVYCRQRGCCRPRRGWRDLSKTDSSVDLCQGKVGF